MTENEKYNYVSGKYLKCLIDFKIFKKDQSYWLEYLGDNVYIGRSDNILNERVTIEPFQLDYFIERQDIKKGDVLVNGPIIIIVDHLGTFENRPIIYSWYFADSQKFYGPGPSEPDRWEAKGFIPATEEQRDLLFQKMKDAGYEWDEDKKELKKL